MKDLSLTPEEVALVAGALDTLGCCLADHEHQWTDGESAVYSEALKILGRDDPKSLSYFSK